MIFFNLIHSLQVFSPNFINSSTRLVVVHYCVHTVVHTVVHTDTAQCCVSLPVQQHADLVAYITKNDR